MVIIAALLLFHAISKAWTPSASEIHRASKRAAPVAFSATVTHVTDGDTIWVTKGKGKQAIHIRLQGIDAPEICQDYGKFAQAALAHHVLHQTVSVTSKARDKYGRMVAKVSVGNEDLGAWLVLSGHAWSNHYRQSLGTYGQQETAARQAGRGLWASGTPVEPKIFRKKTKCHR